MQDTQFPPPSPPHVNPTPTDSRIVQNVPNTSCQNINALTIEDLKKILHQTTLQVQLCTNPILVSVEELQKVVPEITMDKVNPQEPPSEIPLATSGQPMEKTIVDTSKKANYVVKVLMIEHKTQNVEDKEPAKEKTR